MQCAKAKKPDNTLFPDVSSFSVNIADLETYLPLVLAIYEVTDEGSAGSAKGDAPVTAGASSDKKARKDLVEVEADTVPTVEVDDHFSTWTLEDAIDFVGAWNSKSEMEKNRPQDMDDDKWSEVMLLFDIARQCDFNIHRIASFLDEMGRGEPYDFDPVAHDSQEVEGNTMLTESATLSDKNPNKEVSQPEVEECTVLSDSDCEIPPSQPVDSALEEVTNSLADMALSQPAVDLEEDPVLEHILSNQEEDSQVDVLALTSQDFAAAEEEIRQSQGSKVDVATTIPWTAGEEVLEVDVEARSWPKKKYKKYAISILYFHMRDMFSVCMCMHLFMHAWKFSFVVTIDCYMPCPGIPGVEVFTGGGWCLFRILAAFFKGRWLNNCIEGL